MIFIVGWVYCYRKHNMQNVWTERSVLYVMQYFALTVN